MRRIIEVVALGVVLCNAETVLADDTSNVDAGSTEAAVDAPATSSIPSSGASAAPGKFFLGLRLGYGIPMGAAGKDPNDNSVNMTDLTSGQIPIWLDLGYMVTENVMIGIYGQYGFGSTGGKLKNACDGANAADLSCSISDLRFGVQAQYHVSPTESMNPWFGLGFGYEILRFGLSAPGFDGSISYKGFEFANLQGGLDFKPMPMLGIGPFLSLSFGQYGSASASGSVADELGSSSEDIPNKAMHEWLTFGVRGAFNL